MTAAGSARNFKRRRKAEASQAQSDSDPSASKNFHAVPPKAKPSPFTQRVHPLPQSSSNRITAHLSGLNPAFSLPLTPKGLAQFTQFLFFYIHQTALVFRLQSNVQRSRKKTSLDPSDGPRAAGAGDERASDGSLFLPAASRGREARLAYRRWPTAHGSIIKEIRRDVSPGPRGPGLRRGLAGGAAAPTCKRGRPLRTARSPSHVDTVGPSHPACIASRGASSELAGLGVRGTTDCWLAHPVDTCLPWLRLNSMAHHCMFFFLVLLSSIIRWTLFGGPSSARLAYTVTHIMHYLQNKSIRLRANCK
jgi:hypothetical protein